MSRHEQLLQRILSGRSDAKQRAASQAKPYQVRQVRRVILKHKLGEEG